MIYITEIIIIIFIVIIPEIRGTLGFYELM